MGEFTLKLFGPFLDHSAPARALVQSFRTQRTLVGIAGWSILAAIVARTANLAAIVICARVLTQDAFGQVAIILSTVGMFAPLAGLGLAMTTTKFIAENRDANPARAGRILGLCLCVAAAAGLLLTGVLIVAAPLMATARFASPAIQGHLIEASGLLFFGVLEAVQTGALTGLEAFSRIARLNVWNGLLSIPLISWLVLAYGASGAIAGLTVSVAVACLLNAIALRAECSKWGIVMSLAGCSSERSMLMKFSLPSYLSGVLIAPVTWFNSTLLVSQSGGFSEMALFTAAERYRYILIFLPLAVSRIAVPTLSRLRSAGDSDGFRQTFLWNLGFGLLATVPLVLGFIGLSEPMMGVFGETFRRGWPVLAILALSAIPTVINTQLGAALLSNGKAWERAGADVLLAATFLASAWIAVPRWHAIGLAASFAIAYTFASAILWWRLQRSTV